MTPISVVPTDKKRQNDDRHRWSGPNQDDYDGDDDDLTVDDVGDSDDDG